MRLVIHQAICQLRMLVPKPPGYELILLAPMAFQNSPKPLIRHWLRAKAYLRYGRQRAHWQEWLPGLELTKSKNGKPGKVVYEGRLIAQLNSCKKFEKNKHSEITIIGSGPSISGQDLSRLPHNSTLLLNGAIGLIGEQVNHPLAIIIEDERFVWRHFELIRGKITPSVACCFSPPVMRALCEIDEPWLTGRNIILMDNLMKPYGEPRKSINDYNDGADMSLDRDHVTGFSTDPHTGVFPAGTVAYSAFQIAMAASPAKIGFAGVDLASANSPRFYETPGKAAWSGLDKGLARILRGFKLGRRVAGERGVLLENYSGISALNRIGIPYSSRLDNL